MRKWLALISLLIASQAQGAPVLQLNADLNGDGHAESFALTGLDDGEADLQITTAEATLLIENIAWSGQMFGQEPSLELAANGSLRLISRNESIGRHRWSLTLTIAYRQELYRVAGVTYTWYDTLDLTANGRCDINLLTGRGLLSKGDNATKPIKVAPGGISLSDWDDSFVWDGPCQTP